MNEKKLLIIETNKNVYVEKMNKYFNMDFVDAKKVTLNWQDKERILWKLKLNEDTFDNIFDDIRDLPTQKFMAKDATDEYAARQYDYYFADTDSIENKDLHDIKIYNITHFLPFYDWSTFDTYLADILLNRFTDDLANVHLKEMAILSEGLNAISYPLYKNIFSLLGDLKTRREGLLDSYLLLDQEENLSSLALMAHVRIHSKDRHPHTRRPDFDPDKYIKQNLESAKEPFDPDDDVY